MEEDDTGTAIRRDRFSGGPARSFLSSMADDERIFAADLAVDRAHVVMLAEQGIIPDATAGEIFEALAAVEQAGYDALPAGEDVHEAIETAVIDHVGEDGGRMHTARSRNDEVATCIRYRLREDLLAVAAETLTLREQLLETARTEADTVMPGLTHLQPAQPITVGHWALSYVGALARDTERVLDAYGRVNRSPLGGAAFAGTPYPIDRDRTAALLGFDGTVDNAMDAAAGRDVVVEAVATLTTQATTLSGMAADMILYAHRGWLELDDQFASTSSIMPQKKNPDTMELVRASAGDAAASLTGIVTTVKGLPRAYNRDLQGATPHAWTAVDAVAEATAVTAGAIETANWDGPALKSAATEGFSTATGIADQLAMAGIPFRQAHELVATVAERVATEPSAEVVMDALETAAAELDIDGIDNALETEGLQTLLDPLGNVESRDSAGGPAPDEINAQVDRAQEHLDRHRAAIADRRTDLAEAAETLDHEVAQYA